MNDVIDGLYALLDVGFLLGRGRRHKQVLQPPLLVAELLDGLALILPASSAWLQRTCTHLGLDGHVGLLSLVLLALLLQQQARMQPGCCLQRVKMSYIARLPDWGVHGVGWRACVLWSMKYVCPSTSAPSQPYGSSSATVSFASYPRDRHKPSLAHVPVCGPWPSAGPPRLSGASRGS